MQVNPGQYGPIDTNTYSSNTVPVEPNTVQIQSITVPISRLHSQYSRFQSQYSRIQFQYSLNRVKLLWDCIRLDCIGLYSDCIAAVLGLYCDCTYWSALARINLHWDCIGLYLSDVSVLYCFGNVAPSPAALFK